MKYCTTFQFQSELGQHHSAPMRFVCKDDDGFIQCYLKYALSEDRYDELVYELVASQLATLFGITSPTVCLVTVEDGSFDQDNLHYNRLFRVGVTAFGSVNEQNAIELNKLLLINNEREARQYDSLASLVKVVLFDMLLDNRDRTEDNFNLLRTATHPYKFLVIDHATCFGGSQNIGSFHVGLMPDINRTIARSDLFRSAFNYMSREQIESAKDEFYYICDNRKDEIASNVDNVFQLIPVDWIVSEQLDQRIKDFVLNDFRIEKLKSNANNYISLLMNDIGDGVSF